MIDVYFMKNAMIATSCGGNVSGFAGGANAVDSKISASNSDKSSCTARSPTDDDACANAAESDIAVLQQMLYKLLLVPQRELELGMIGIPTTCMMTMHHIGDIIVMPWLSHARCLP